jgi:predicted N-acyltransferase
VSAWPPIDTEQALQAQTIAAVAEVGQAAWDACAGPDNPFVRYAFLHALELSGSVGTEQSGWLPQHIVIRFGEGGPPVALVPMYLKLHSYGEYVFDHGWADGYERAGGRYYPKLQAAIPFTPATGPRVLLHPGVDDPLTLRRRAASVMAQIAQRMGVSSVHLTFPTKPEWDAFGEAGWCQRLGHQYHWFNNDYGSFDDFLAELNARKRKAIKKERRQVAESGLKVEVLTGAAIKTRHWDAFFQFYTDTGHRKWGAPYLTEPFFHEIGATMANDIALVMASDGDELVAGALNLIGTDALYGRHWGCVDRVKFLHFEACYYQAIAFAIARGLSRVEAGAQGEHKIQRGYVPVPTYSAHWIADPRFRDAVEDFVTRERRAVVHRIDALENWSPFRKTDGDPAATLEVDAGEILEL